MINLHIYLKKTHKEFAISQQLLRSGTAIGALVREAEHAESFRDFIHKLNIGLKEANETVYWLELIFVTGYITKRMFDSVIKDATELLKMLASSVKTSRQKLTKQSSKK